METITATAARKDIYRLLETVTESHQPIQIKGKHRACVLIGEEDWRAIQDTLYLLQIPGMRESIRKGLDTPVENCSEELIW
jgi:antitoxin YefM